jgi:hypothetical protein
MFDVNFTSRDGSPFLLPSFSVSPVDFSWCAFGGPESATFRLDGPSSLFFNLTPLLRAGVMVHDHLSNYVWHGFVNEIQFFIDGTCSIITLDNLYNKIGFAYNYFPGLEPPVLSTLGTIDNLASQLDFGVRDYYLRHNEFDEVFAMGLQADYLRKFSTPSTSFSSVKSSGSYIILKCQGWFKSLDWIHYSNLSGYIFNAGPGPGSFEFENNSTTRNAGQLIKPTETINISEVYYKLRRVGSHARNFYARIYDVSSATNIADSDVHTAAELNEDGWEWVKFTFDPPCSCVAGDYIIFVRCPDGTNTYNHFSIRMDGAANLRNSKAQYYNGSAYVNMTSVYYGVPDLYFRVIGVEDTGSILYSISDEVNQFFSSISTVVSGLNACPFVELPVRPLPLLYKYMTAGFSSGGLILANVTPDQRLVFYKEPSPSDKFIYIDQSGSLFSNEYIPIPSYIPPVGLTAYFSGTDRLTLPFDVKRFPSLFIFRATHTVATGFTRFEPISLLKDIDIS